MILGIDVGGTTVKFGIVSEAGDIKHQNAYDTGEWGDGVQFVHSLKDRINEYLKFEPLIKGVGIGWPGLLSKDRKTVIKLPNIPSVENINVYDQLKKAFPSLEISLENDAKCAALGEMYFGEDKTLDDFAMITLGTGVGSAAVIDRKLFLGARGNAMESGHILSTNGKTIEQNIGHQQIVQYALNNMKLNETTLPKVGLSPKVMYEAAVKGDAYAKEVFEWVGSIIGECSIALMRVLDLQTIVLSGGVAGAFEFIEPAIIAKCKELLPTYYTDNLKVVRATLKTNTGILGAASLILQDYHAFEEID